MAAGTGIPSAGPRAAAPLANYAVGVVVTIVAVLSQYFVPQTIVASRVVYGSFVGDVFVVYGIPVLAFALLVGRRPLRDWSSRPGLAAWEGLRWYGLLSLLALAILFALVVVYEIVDPSALGLLSRPNPAVTQAESDPWFYVGFSFVIGAFEETIFRGWIFGYWRDRASGWVGPAAWTSAIFAGVHLYYGTTYGAASPLIFPTLYLTGFALAATYRFSGGNLVVPALLHGTNDATAYVEALISTEWGAALHYGVILVGGLIGLIAYLRRERVGGPPPPFG